MPQIIPGLREKILEAAQRILLEEGYEAYTIRKVAQDCGIAIGTVYNYYKGKDELAAFVMLRDWNQMIGEMADLVKGCDSLENGLNGLVELLLKFVHKYKDIWEQSASDAKVNAGSYALRYHKLLVEQISEQILVLLAACGREELALLASLLAELALAAAMHENITAEQIDFLVGMLAGSKHKL